MKSGAPAKWGLAVFKSGHRLFQGSHYWSSKVLESVLHTICASPALFLEIVLHVYKAYLMYVQLCDFMALNGPLKSYTRSLKVLEYDTSLEWEP